MTLVTALFSPAPFQYINRDVILHLDRTSCCTSQIYGSVFLFACFKFTKMYKGDFHRSIGNVGKHVTGAREREREREA